MRRTIWKVFLAVVLLKVLKVAKLHQVVLTFLKAMIAMKNAIAIQILSSGRLIIEILRSTTSTCAFAIYSLAKSSRKCTYSSSYPFLGYDDESWSSLMILESKFIRHYVLFLYVIYLHL